MAISFKAPVGVPQYDRRRVITVVGRAITHTRPEVDHRRVKQAAVTVWCIRELGQKIGEFNLNKNLVFLTNLKLSTNLCW
jgi:hypothetical protein